MKSKGKRIFPVIKKVTFSLIFLAFLSWTSLGWIRDVSGQTTRTVRDDPDYVCEGTVEGICDFPIHFENHGHLRETFIDSPKVKVLTSMHRGFFNKYEANGKVLQGLKTSFMLQGTFDENYELIDFNSAGQLEKIPLPDGTLFISSGLLSLEPNFFPNPGTGTFLCSDGSQVVAQYWIVVGAGASGDVSAFCDALSAAP